MLYHELGFIGMNSIRSSKSRLNASFVRKQVDAKISLVLALMNISNRKRWGRFGLKIYPGRTLRFYFQDSSSY